MRTAYETVAAYKGFGSGMPDWVAFGIVILAFVVFGIAQARRRK